MCARFYIDPDAKRFALTAAEEMGLLLSDETDEFEPTDIVPTKTAPALVLGPEKGSLVLTPITWGYPSFDGKQVIINARAESVRDKRLFRHGFENSRALFPAGHFYEWNRQKEKFTFEEKDHRPFFLCGFCDLFDGKYRFVILTRKANEQVSPVHDRMPVIAEDAAKAGTFLLSQEGAETICGMEGPSLVSQTDYQQLSLF